MPSLEGAKDYDAVLKIVRDSLPTKKPRAIGNIAGQLWAFAVAMNKDDLVVLPRKLTSQVAIGRVKGPYRYQKVGGDLRHTRPVEWVRPDVPRTAFEQDLLHSFGAFMTVCNISRNDAERRVAAVLTGKPDPGPALRPTSRKSQVVRHRRSSPKRCPTSDSSRMTRLLRISRPASRAMASPPLWMPCSARRDG